MPTLIDPRGARVAAALTSVVLALVLLTAPGAVATALLGVQAAVFAVGAVAGVQRTPYAWLFRTFVRPRLGPPGELEDAAPPRFAQAVGLGFALVAALLNAALGLCLGCEVYLLLRRLTTSTTAARPAATN